MAKHKKKKKKHDIDPIVWSRKRLDEELDYRYGEVYDEIQEMNKMLYAADQKELIKMRHQAYNGKFLTDERLKARLNIIRKADERNWFTKVLDLITDIVNHSDVLKMFARVVAQFIFSLLSLDTVKKYVTPSLLATMDKIYGIAVNL